MSPQCPTALIIGASRGLGWGLAREYLRRGWHVVATVRDAQKRTALHDLRDEHDRRQYPEGSLRIEEVDITQDDEVAALHERLRARKFDLLYVNASISNDPHGTIEEVATDEFIRVMRTNTLSPMR